MITHLIQGCDCTGQPCRSCHELRCIQAYTTRYGRQLKRCKPCRDAKREQRRQASPRQTRTREPRTKITPERLQELRAMPYPEYLRQPEWQAHRKKLIRFARARCQVCNAGNVLLNVHHRVYNLGEEHLSDTIVLCQPCHELFHTHRKLSKAN
jgi:hypothetical protein